MESLINMLISKCLNYRTMPNVIEVEGVQKDQKIHIIPFTIVMMLVLFGIILATLHHNDDLGTIFKRYRNIYIKYLKGKEDENIIEGLLRIITLIAFYVCLKHLFIYCYEINQYYFIIYGKILGISFLSSLITESIKYKYPSKKISFISKIYGIPFCPFIFTYWSLKWIMTKGINRLTNIIINLPEIVYKLLHTYIIIIKNTIVNLYKGSYKYGKMFLSFVYNNIILPPSKLIYDTLYEMYNVTYNLSLSTLELFNI